MEWILKKEWWKDLGWINLAQGCYQQGSESPESHKIEGFLKQQIIYQFLQKSCALYSMELVSEFNNATLNQ